MARGRRHTPTSGVLSAPFHPRVVYRTGSLTKLVPDGAVQEQWALADARRPSGRVGRLEGLFCAPLAAQAARWSLHPAAVRRPGHCVQLELHPDAEPWSYDADAWCAVDAPYRDWRRAQEAGDAEALARHRAQLDAAIDAYWESGVPLAQLADTRPEWCGERPCAEVLVAPEWCCAGRWFTAGPRPRQGRRRLFGGLCEELAAVTGAPAARHGA